MQSTATTVLSNETQAAVQSVRGITDTHILYPTKTRNNALLNYACKCLYEKTKTKILYRATNRNSVGQKNLLILTISKWISKITVVPKLWVATRKWVAKPCHVGRQLVPPKKYFTQQRVATIEIVVHWVAKKPEKFKWVSDQKSLGTTAK
jgi:hypothetical protein